MNVYAPAQKETMYFIGVTTKKSSIMRVFPKWMEHLGIDAEIKGFDFIPHDKPEDYREAVQFIKNDPKSLGALVTTHKLDCYKASRDLFDGAGPYTQLLEEASSISKRGKELWAHAKDPVTSGLALEAFMPEGYFADSNAVLYLIGAGGSSLALTLYLINKARVSRDVPRKIIVTNRSTKRLEEMKEIHAGLNYPFVIEYKHCPTAEENDAVVAALPEGSLVVNATGLGKDTPGSPLTEAVQFPKNGYVWEFNYRGDLVFLDQANAQKREKNLTIEDGWVYFIHGWTRVIAEVFHLDIPTSGPGFDKLSEIARAARS
ncbi:MAG: shikimate dehydrogenase [Spirochaetales bacterium]|jgi:shikimate 5-dehydrogenase|nr:shikimate dehydrogenase [Spirochaetales bacterium]